MKSMKLKKLVASIAIMAMTSVVIPASFANAIPVFENGWSVNNKGNITSIKGDSIRLTNNATKLTESSLSVDKIEASALTTDVVVDNKTYEAGSSEGGVLRVGLRLNGDLERALRSHISDAVSEYRDNVNNVNANRHNQGNVLRNDRQIELARLLATALNVENASGTSLNNNVRFTVSYELSDGRARTTSVNLSDATFEEPVIDGSMVGSTSDLRSLVDENGLVYLTFRGLPTNVTITNIELDSRRELSVATNNLDGSNSNLNSLESSKYSVQSNLDYNAGRVYVPSSTWILTNSLYPSVTVNGASELQFNDSGTIGTIERGEHVFVDVAATTVTLVDLFRDPNKVITSATVTDRRGDTFKAEVGDFAKGKYNGTDVDYGTRYRDLKITGLNNKTTYDFEYMDITYNDGNVERTQRIKFDNALATGRVTGDKYLTVTTSNYLSSQIYGYNSLIASNSSTAPLLYQVEIGRNSLTYLVKVDDVTNLDRIEVRGLRNGETYQVRNVKSENGKKENSNWFAIEITGLEENRNYDFLSLETVYNENGRERYGSSISLGRSTTDFSSVLFPGNNLNNSGTSNAYNQFTTTNNGRVSEVWIDSQLKYESVPGGVKFYGRVKDADNILSGVNVYVNNGGSYEKVSDTSVTYNKVYRVTKGMDVDSDGYLDETAEIVYPHISNGTGTSIRVQESSVESASEMVEVVVTGISSDRVRDFRLEFTTSKDGSSVSTILEGAQGAFGSIPTSNTKTQQAVTRYVSGRAGNTQIKVNTSNVQVSNIRTVSASVNAGITNTGKESIAVEVSGTGVSGVTAKYNVDTNLIDLTGLTADTNYTNLKLTLKYGNTSTVVNVPTFKTSASGTTGQAGIVGYVTRVYSAFFNRQPDQQGLSYWTQRLAKGEETLKGFLGQLSFTPELLEKNMTNQKFVESMYAIVDRAGETEGVAFWVSEIDKLVSSGVNQSEARADAVSRMLETEEVKSMATKLGIKFE